MPRGASPLPLTLTLLLAGALAGACGSAARAATNGGEETTVRRGDAPAFPMGPADAPVLTSLPELSTYAWIAPSAVFSGVGADDDSLALSDHAASLRETASAVLRANGWRETAPDSASYHLAIVQVSRTGMRTELRPDPRSERIPPLVCPTLSRERQQLCSEPPPRQYPPIRREVPYTDSRVTFGIVRVHDSATRWWLLDTSQLNMLARGTVELLRANPRP
jgi:hypothetical protein